jgi:hypothetical protein
MTGEMTENAMGHFMRTSRKQHTNEIQKQPHFKKDMKKTSTT